MPSITWWNRIEPRPRTHTIADTLSARIRDATWMLARQWQVGEFLGTDAGSPAYAQLSASMSPVIGWRTQGPATQPFDGRVPLEEAVESEPFGPNYALSVELAQVFDGLLGAINTATRDLVRPALRQHYPIVEVPDHQLKSWADQEAARFVRICGGRTADGIALHVGASEDFNGAVTNLASTGGDKSEIETSLRAFLETVERVYGTVGLGDAPAWRPEQLEFELEVIAADASGNSIVLGADPDRDGAFDWSAFDLRPGGSAGMAVPSGNVETRRESVIPGHVRFRGMPNTRWWDFETNITDFGEIKPDRRDLARLIVMEFMLVHGNDWFAIPFDQPVGMLCSVDWLIVHDVFGVDTLIQRADALQLPVEKRWSMFSTAVEGDSAALAGFFILPPSASTTAQSGASIEEVRFFRDEMANMAWAVEHVAENGIGEPWQGHERDLALHPPPDIAPGGQQAGANGTGAGETPLRYLIQTRIPEHWLPVVPVSLDPATGETAFEVGRAQRIQPDGTPELANPSGRILQPSGVGSVYHIREEEIPRLGLRVSRVVQRSRWTDGTTHLWISRRKQPGPGEGSSGLRFDQALRVGEPD